MKEKYLIPLLKYRFVASWLVILGLFGFTLYKLTLISQPRTDAQYLEQQQTTIIPDIKIAPALSDELEKLESTKVNTQPKNLGQVDPFNP